MREPWNQSAGQLLAISVEQAVGGKKPSEKAESSAIARPGQRDSFIRAEAHAREVLRARGFSREQIERELQRVKREQLD
jgi:hypothetical protein